MKYAQSGRSMIEMLGVLAIIGVLSVGGLDMVSKARRNNKIAGLISSVSNLSGTILQQRKYASEIENSYAGNFALFLKQTGKIPAGLQYDETNKKFTGELSAGIVATLDDGIVSLEVSGIDKETCMRVASNNWGDSSNNRFRGIEIGTVSSSVQMNVAEAMTACASKQEVKLKYKL